MKIVRSYRPCNNSLLHIPWFQQACHSNHSCKRRCAAVSSLGYWRPVKGNSLLLVKQKIKVWRLNRTLNRLAKKRTTRGWWRWRQYISLTISVRFSDIDTHTQRANFWISYSIFEMAENNKRISEASIIMNWGCLICLDSSAQWCQLVKISDRVKKKKKLST